MQSERVVIITDIHGCLDECRQLLDKLSFDKTKDMLINLGDTIDRGPKIYELFVYLRELKEEMGDRFVLIKGNHEQMMLDATDGSGSRSARAPEVLVPLGTELVAKDCTILPFQSLCVLPPRPEAGS